MFVQAKAKHIRLGNAGESIAVRFLRQRQYDILAIHYKPSSNSGEIDIVARDGGILRFIEVKTRTYSKFRKNYDKMPWVGLSQIKRNKHAARDYMSLLGNPKILFSFDLIEIYISRFGVRKLEYWIGNYGRR